MSRMTFDTLLCSDRLSKYTRRLLRMDTPGFTEWDGIMAAPGQTSQTQTRCLKVICEPLAAVRRRYRAHCIQRTAMAG
jgi:hypothetical protein